jgi:hypothetical protein
MIGIDTALGTVAGFGSGVFVRLLARCGFPQSQTNAAGIQNMKRLPINSSRFY